MRLALWIALLTLAPSCAVTRPCSQGGDTGWPEKVPGDQYCHQKKLPDGNWVNHGNYKAYFKDGSVMIEGGFKEGRKDGLWVQYDAKGRKVLERYFEDGLEKSRFDAPKK